MRWILRTVLDERPAAYMALHAPIRCAFSRVGSDNIPNAVAWLAERGVTASRSEAYMLRIDEQKEAQRKAVSG